MDLAKVKRDLVMDQMAAAKAAAKRLRDQFIALLDEATPEQFEVVRLAALVDVAPQDGFAVNVDFRLTGAQKAELDKAREARVEQCKKHKDEWVKPIMDDKEQELTTFKVRMAKTMTRTTCVFTKKSK